MGKKETTFRYKRTPSVCGWSQADGVYVDGVKQMVDHYTTDEQEELKMTDMIAVSTYVQGNGPETET
jgi:hypothetical protein